MRYVPRVLQEHDIIAARHTASHTSPHACWTDQSWCERSGYQACVQNRIGRADGSYNGRVEMGRPRGRLFDRVPSLFFRNDKMAGVERYTRDSE